MTDCIKNSLNSVNSQGCVQKTLTDEQMQVLNYKGLEVSGNLDLGDVLGMLPKTIKRQEMYDGMPIVQEYNFTIEADSHTDYNWLVMYNNTENTAISHSKCKELIDGIFDLIVWCIDNGHIHTNKQNKAFPHISRQQIIDKLTDWFSNGILTTTQIVGEQPRVIESLCNKRELSYTPINRLLLVGDSKGSEVFKELKALIDGRRILAPLTAKVETDTRTDYGVLQASKRGELYRFVYCGLILYID